ncbi:NUDIX hydrolase [Croceibacterium aestuarii]|uniref:NUDIX hydrolase n=1 Tax=Croceibacterium aestuarii TaxID=3064139 RepID=UPI00272E6EF2|nr:NUDIX domain-containing protein [Croceibacterium sp. D39]
MLHLIPPFLHRWLYRAAYRLRGRWRRWSKRPSQGVAVIGRDAEERILLVRHSYGSGRWALPGGGLGRREDPADCARRELREELGCDLAALELFEVVEREIQGAPNRSFIFVARIEGRPVPDGRELIAADWFAPGALPAELVYLSRRQIERFLGPQSNDS